MKYQPEVDGLRALAVLFFHSGWAVFSGGYVGVDVFFVISGYLITGILAAELADNRFSILNFYERRIRRIMPCLLAVIIASSVAAAILLVPMDFRDFAKSVVATLFFASNVLFFRQSGYFDEQSEIKPMLHTWSLAVEEQYYIFFPILLWLIHRYARDRMFLLLAPMAILSFACSVWGVRHAPAFTFFMAPTRIWELFADALLALGLAPAIEKRVIREALSWLGLGLIGYAIIVFTESTRFPGFNALFPVVGSIADPLRPRHQRRLAAQPPDPGLHRTHLVFALSLALADHRVLGIPTGSRAERPGDGGRHCGVADRGDPVLALRRAAVPRQRPCHPVPDLPGRGHRHGGHGCARAGGRCLKRVGRLEPLFKPLFRAPPATAVSSPAVSPPRSRGTPAPPSGPSPSHRARGR